MALDKAILEICSDMEKEPEAGSKDLSRLNLKTYAKMLRMAVKAAEAETPQARTRAPTCARCFAPSKELSEDGRLCVACQGDRKEREEKEKRRSTAEEVVGGRGALILDGPLFDPAQSTTIPIPPDMPINAFVPVQGFWYQLKTTGLRHAPHREEEARKLKEQEENGVCLVTTGTPGGIILGKG